MKNSLGTGLRKQQPDILERRRMSRMNQHELQQTLNYRKLARDSINLNMQKRGSSVI
jgi:hypothetical protein